MPAQAPGGPPDTQPLESDLERLRTQLDATDVTTENLWALPEGEYVVALGVFRVVNYKHVPVYRTQADLQVQSRAEARHLFSVYTDLGRRVRKLEKAARRLF